MIRSCFVECWCLLLGVLRQSLTISSTGGIMTSGEHDDARKENANIMRMLLVTDNCVAIALAVQEFPNIQNQHFVCLLGRALALDQCSEGWLWNFVIACC